MGDLDKELLAEEISACARTIMPFDMGARFPMMPYARLVLRGDRILHTQETEETEAADIDGLHLARQRALSLVTGGIFDRVGGGFHRYTVDSTWTVPHFEKLLSTAVVRVEELPKGIVGMVCEGLRCRKPAKTLEELRSQIQQSQESIRR